MFAIFESVLSKPHEAKSLREKLLGKKKKAIWKRPLKGTRGSGVERSSWVPALLLLLLFLPFINIINNSHLLIINNAGTRIVVSAFCSHFTTGLLQQMTLTMLVPALLSLLTVLSRYYRLLPTNDCTDTGGPVFVLYSLY
jgi:hypothetical protein